MMAVPPLQVTRLHQILALLGAAAIVAFHWVQGDAWTGRGAPLAERILLAALLGAYALACELSAAVRQREAGIFEVLVTAIGAWTVRASALEGFTPDHILALLMGALAMSLVFRSALRQLAFLVLMGLLLAGGMALRPPRGVEPVLVLVTLAVMAAISYLAALAHERAEHVRRAVLERSRDDTLAALDRTTARLERAERLEALGRLAGSVAHDFNNVLAIIVGYIELLQEERGLTRPVRNALGHMDDAARHGANLTAQLLETILEGSGVDAVAASNFAEARALLDAEPFDVLVTDLELPDGEGVTLAEQVARVAPHIALVCISGRAPAASVERRMARCHATFLAKPFGRGSLLEAIRRARRARPLPLP